MDSLVYIWGGMSDTVISPLNFEMLQQFYSNFRAKVSYNVVKDQGHDLIKDIEQDLLKYLLENLPGTGFEPNTKPLKPAEEEITTEKSRFIRFD